MELDLQKSHEELVDMAQALGYKEGVLDCVEIVKNASRSFENQEGIRAVISFLLSKVEKETSS